MNWKLFKIEQLFGSLLSNGSTDTPNQIFSFIVAFQASANAEFFLFAVQQHKRNENTWLLIYINTLHLKYGIILSGTWKKEEESYWQDFLPNRIERVNSNLRWISDFNDGRWLYNVCTMCFSISQFSIFHSVDCLCVCVCVCVYFVARFFSTRCLFTHIWLFKHATQIYE